MTLECTTLCTDQPENMILLLAALLLNTLQSPLSTQSDADTTKQPHTRKLTRCVRCRCRSFHSFVVVVALTISRCCFPRPSVEVWPLRRRVRRRSALCVRAFFPSAFCVDIVSVRNIGGLHPGDSRRRRVKVACSKCISFVFVCDHHFVDLSRLMVLLACVIHRSGWRSNAKLARRHFEFTSICMQQRSRSVRE